MAIDVYVTRTPIDKNGGSIWDYLYKQAAETGLMVEDDEFHKTGRTLADFGKSTGLFGGTISFLPLF